MKYQWLSKISSAVLIVMLALAALPVTRAYALTCTSAASGNWSAAGTWSGCGGGTPGAGDNVIIAANHTVTVNVNSAASSITINSATAANGITISGTNSLTVTNSITMNAVSTNNVTSSLGVGAGTLSAASISIAGGNGNRVSQLSISTGTVNVSGNITFSGTATNARLIFTGAGILNLQGNLGAGGTFTASTGTVNLNGAAQTLAGYAYNNLTLGGSSFKTMVTGTSVNGTMNIIPTAVASIIGGATIINVTALSLNSVGQVDGMWGSTTSTATNQNNTYFNNGINPSGRLNVTTNTGLITPTLSITNSPLTYNGLSQAAIVTCSSGGAVSNILYDGSGTVPTNAGTYAVTADCAAVPGFTALTGASAGNFVIDPANQTATVTNSPQNYTGAAQSATVSCSGGGVATNISTGGAASQINAGTYAVTADCPAVAPNYNAGTGLAAGNFVINPVNQTATVTNSPQNYTGVAQSATVSCSGGGVATNISTGGAASQINAGTYAVTADCPAVAPNYNASAGLAAGNFIITPAAPTASITNSPVIYNGLVQTATVACSGGGAATLASGGTGTNVGSYPATVDCAASANYTAASGLAAGNFIINPAIPTASITNSPVIYNGLVQTATVACSGGGAATLASGGAGTNVGSYPATVDCAASANYTAASGLAAGNFVINLAGQTITVTTSAPPAATNGSTFNVSATASSGLPVAITTGGVCSGSGTASATITMTSGTGTCNVFYDQAGNVNYAAALQVQEDVSATESPTFTSANNTSFDVGFAGAFNITAVGNPSTIAISASGVLPSGVSLTDNGDGTATLSGTPAVGSNGVYNLIFTADNGVAPNGIQNFTLTIKTGPVIRADGIGSIPDTGNGSIVENEIIATTLNIMQLTVEFSQDVYDPAGDGDPDDVTNPANYLLVRGTAAGTFSTVSCAGDVVPPDLQISVDAVTYSNGGGSGPFIATININSGLPLNIAGFYRLYVCGTTSIVDAANTSLTLAGNGVTPGTDFVRNFRLQEPTVGGGGSGGGGGGNRVTAPITSLSGLLIPVTGFTPGMTTRLPEQPREIEYAPSRLRLVIPSLSLDLPIVGVELKENGWDVTWLGNNAGYLEGSAYPTWKGNTILTGHVTDPNGKAGPFAYVNELKDGSKVYIHNNGFVYVYEVRQSDLILPSSIESLFQSEQDAWLTLVTCENYNASTNAFTHRRMIRAVLISIIPAK